MTFRPSSSTPPVEHYPAPWTTKTETYMFLIKLSELPEGVYDPLEASSAAFVGEEAGEWRGGIGMVMVVRYERTPCGPYDELILIPGVFDVKGEEKKRTRRRITRIYVSQKETTWNGRHNWNIPKHLARFAFTSPPVRAGQPPPRALHLSVYPPSESATTPLFSATLSPFKWVPAMPFNSKFIPLSTTIAQPPIPSGSSIPLSSLLSAFEHSELGVLAGTDEWRETAIKITAPRARGCWVDVHSPKKIATADGRNYGTMNRENSDSQEPHNWFPQNIRPWPFGVGVWIEEADIVIDVPREWVSNPALCHL